MKKLYLLKTIILLCALIAGSGSVWADEVAVASFSRSGNTDTTTGGTFSATFSAKSGYYQDNTGDCYIQILNNSAYWTTTPTSISLTANIGGGSGNTDLTDAVYVVLLDASGNEISSTKTSITSHITTNTGDNYNISIPVANNVYGVKISHNKQSGFNVRYFSFSLSYEAAGGGSSLTTSDLALTGVPIALNFDLYNKSDAQVINYTTSSTGAVTIDDNSYATFVINESAKTITVTPKAVTPSVQTITVNQAADATYDAGSATFTLTITDSTPIPTHTATFSVNGETSTQDFAEGADIVFPSDPAAISGKSFVGWVTEAITGTTNTAPTIVTSATMGNSDITYYAVFADETPGTETSTTKTITTSTENIPTSYGTANKFTEYTFEGIKFKVQQMYLTGGKLQWRAAGNSNGTGTMYNTDALNKIQSVVLTYADGDNNKNFTLAVGDSENPTSGTSVTPLIYQGNQNVYAYDCSSYNKSYFVLTNGSGAGYLASIAITYLEGTPETYSNYCTTVIVAAVETPEITVAENPFQISTTATITCETVGAAIKYSFDGENWSDYSGPLTITSTTTIYAKAEKDGDVSAIASVTATKELVETAVFIYDTDITNDAVNINNGEAGNLLAIVAAYNADEDDYQEIEGKTVTWSGNNNDVATIDPTTGEVTLTGTGEVTFTATYASDDYYKGSTDTYTLTVVNRYYVTLPEDDDYGTYEMDVYNPVAVGEEVMLTYTPDTGYENYQATWSVNGTPISGNKFTMPNEAVTVTVSLEEEKDYATLPFNWEGGARSDLTNLTGVTANGVGDYASNNSPYLVKFDTDDDYILIKTDSQPGKVTIGVKMIGGANTSSITVQGSSDGTNFTDVETLTISGSLNHVLSLETSNSFAATDRYVRLLFKKGSNVGVGPITIAKPSTDPVINASNVELACDATSGEIAYTISNPVQGESLTATSNDSWITNVTVDTENSKVTFGTTANTGNERSGCITLSYTGADNRVVTVTQARYTVNATYTLITSVDDITPGKHYVIASSNEDGDAKVMGAQSSTDNNRVAVSGATIATINNEKVLTVSNEYEFVFYGPDANGNYTICDANTNGYLYAPTVSGNLLRTQVTNDANGKWTIELDDERNDGTMIITSQVGYKLENVMKYNSSNSLFSCYIANKESPVYLYEKNNDDQAVATTASVTLNAYGYATFASTSALDFLDADAAGYSAWQIYDISGETIDFRQIENHVEPGTGILLKGTANGTAKINLLPAGGEELDYNKLEGITAAKTISDGEYYGLSGNQFVKVNGGTVKAGKALLPANKVPSGARLTFVFEDVQGISTVEHAALSTDDAIYSISGQRVNTPKKGLYIMNGKKMLVK